MKHRTLAFCANSKYSDRNTIYYGWIVCKINNKRVRTGRNVCPLYIHEDIKIEVV